MSSSAVTPPPEAAAGGVCVAPAAGEVAGERAMRADARRNRERVIQAATEAFAEEGIAVPMDVIARRAGVGVGTIYRQFPTKESLYSAVVRHEMEQFLEEARRLGEPGRSGCALFAFFERLLEVVASKRDLVEILERSGEDLKAHSAEVQAEWNGVVGLLVERAQQAGAVRCDVALDDVLALMAGSCAAVMHSRLDGPSRQRLSAVVCDGLRPRS
ncbi:MAG TPA: TetR/AcrR family transcriptional regulator [Acidimicrobiales bacterium]|nr:TetR/AcrR family transcriptional regulator [Acidimicrobiales bacterium]